MKTILILFSVFELFSFSALADVLNGVYAGTNNVILPGFTLPYDQLSGALNLTTNYATLDEFRAATNSIITNAAVVNAKAFSATLAANNSTFAVAFSAPYLATTNYSVGIFAQDAATAGSLRAGQSWWADTKATNGFTLHAAFATNAYDLNFDVIVRMNTQ